MCAEMCFNLFSLPREIKINNYKNINKRESVFFAFLACICSLSDNLCLAVSTALTIKVATRPTQTYFTTGSICPLG